MTDIPTIDDKVQSRQVSGLYGKATASCTIVNKFKVTLMSLF